MQHLVTRWPNNYLPWITKQVKKLIRRFKWNWSVYIFTGSEKYASIYCKTRNARKALISKAINSDEKQSVKSCENSPKRFLSYIERTQKWWNPTTIGTKNPTIFARSDVAKAEGLEEYDIHPRILKALVDVTAELLVVLFYMVLGQSELPRNWKDAIYEAGSRDLVNNYRPVSITSVVVKLMGKIIQTALLIIIIIYPGNNFISEKTFHACQI